MSQCIVNFGGRRSKDLAGEKGREEIPAKMAGVSLADGYRKSIDAIMRCMSGASERDQASGQLIMILDIRQCNEQPYMLVRCKVKMNE